MGFLTVAITGMTVFEGFDFSVNLLYDSRHCFIVLVEVEIKDEIHGMD